MTVRSSDSDGVGASGGSGNPPTPVGPTVVSGEATLASPLAESAGARIGDYTLLQLIGEGGFGSVFMAEQQRPVRRRVALKIIKLGMDTKQVIARFEAERQALAMMEHPHIARVLDAGATDAGRPYFVMELVKGEPITDYCDRNRLGIAERLGLFAQVCSAVQHAHQKGVIHRDIKPSNVLVSSQDGAPSAKVIDFGVAKATNSRLTERTLFTEQRQIIGTPEYMSPEQAEGSLDIDTRTDVYALGVLLYELLTGQTPFDPRSLRSAAYAEIQRMIREVDPPKPSTRLSHSPETVGSVAACRGMEPRRLGSVIRGELDWIVMKAMEKDRARRYDTASGLALDIQRYISGEPVQAAPPSAAYRVRKFVRRNKGVVAATGAVGVALVFGVAGFAWQASVARGERDRARLAQTAESEQRQVADQQRDRAVEAEAETARRASELAKVAEFQASQLSGLDVSQMGVRLRESLLAAAPESVRTGLGEGLDSINLTSVALDTLDRNIFDRTLGAIDAQFEDQPEVRARLLHTVAQTLQKLGLSARALGPEQRSLEIRGRELGEDHPDTLSSAGGVGAVLMALGRQDEAAPYYARALDGRVRVLGEDHPDTLASLAESAYLLLGQGRYAESEAMYRRALEGRVRVLGDEHRDTLVALNGVGYALVMQGRLAEAEPFWLEAYETGLRLFGPGDPDVVVWTNNMGGLLGGLGQRPRAEALYREAMEAGRRLLGDEHPSTLRCATNVALTLSQLGRYPEAEALYERTLAIQGRVLGAGHPDSLTSRIGLAGVYRATGRLDLAEPLLREVLEARRRRLGEDHSETLDALSAMAHLLSLLNRPAESEAMYSELLARARRVAGPEHPTTLTTLNNFGAMLITNERYAEAVPMLREALETRRRVSGLDHPETITATSTLGRALHGQGEYDEAETLFQAGLEAARRVFGPDHPNTFNAVANVALASRSRGRLAEAETLYLESIAGYARVLGENHAQTGSVRQGLARTLMEMGRFAEAETQYLECERVLGSAQGVSPLRHRQSVEGLIAMYEAWQAAEPGAGAAEKAAPWRARLAGAR